MDMYRVEISASIIRNVSRAFDVIVDANNNILGLDIKNLKGHCNITMSDIQKQLEDPLTKRYPI